MADRRAHPPVHPGPKPEKPFADFPLYWHTRGFWAKKRDGRHVNYGPDALKAYDRLKADERDLADGKPVGRVLNHTFRDAVNLYLDRQDRLRGEGQITDRHFAMCRQKVEAAAKVVGLNARLHTFSGETAGPLFRKIRAEALKHGLEQARAGIGTVRACLDYAARKRLMPPPAYGDDFDKPTALQFRRSRQAAEAKDGQRAFTLAECQTLVADARTHSAALYAYVLLGLNCAMGSGDLGGLPWSALDRAERCLRFPRSKTALPRLCPLWPETLAAIDAVPKYPPAKPEYAALLLRTRKGNNVARTNVKSDEKGPRGFSRTDSVQLAFRRCMGRCGVKRKGLGFYSLRSAFRVQAMGSGADPAAVYLIMGQKHKHAMDSYYVRGDLLDQLRTVTDHVRAKFLTSTSPTASAGRTSAKARPASKASPRPRAAEPPSKTRSRTRG